ncbi:helix-turn-helix transcriptional regulator [Acidobacteriota bacterium]
MDKSKKKRLEKKGWKVGGVKEYLGLSDEEMAYIDMKLSLSQNLRKRRCARKMTQEQVARLLKSSQSRVAKMEAGDPSVSIDLLVRSLLALGATRKELARAITTTKAALAT